MFGYGLKLMEMAGKGLKWDGLITVFWVWGVWEIQIGGLGIGGFSIGSGKTRSPGLVWTDLVQNKKYIFFLYSLFF